MIPQDAKSARKLTPDRPAYLINNIPQPFTPCCRFFLPFIKFIINAYLLVLFNMINVLYKKDYRLFCDQLDSFKNQTS